MTTDPLTQITALRGMQYRTEAVAILDALEADVRRLTQERDDATRAQQLAENDRAAAADEVRRLTTERDAETKRANQLSADHTRMQLAAQSIIDDRDTARSERDDARAALRAIAKAPDDEDPAAAGIRLRAVARRALGEDTP